MQPTNPDNAQVLPEYAVQAALAALIVDPRQRLFPVIKDQYPRREDEFHFKVLTQARQLLKDVLDTVNERAAEAPILVDRLSFCWRTLHKADVNVWRLKKGMLPAVCQMSDAAKVFDDLLPSTQTAEPMLKAVLNVLRVGANAEYLYHYWVFRRSKRPLPLPAPLGDAVEREDWENIRRIAWWCVRARREEYVEIDDKEGPRVEFAFLLETVLEELMRWLGKGAGTLPSGRLSEVVEEEINKWLAYSALDLYGDSQEGSEGSDKKIQSEIARAFLKYNEMTIRLHVHRPGAGKPGDAKTEELERAIRSYAAENRALEESNQELRSQLALLRENEATQRKDAEAPPIQSTGSAELYEALRTIDAKYSFDVLSAVLAGEESHLTLRSFVAHLFYSLRKRGLDSYPKEEEFVLHYDESGLYDCEGFEVPPNGESRVKVVRKGWAIMARGQVIPVRRAKVAESK